MGANSRFVAEIFVRECGEVLAGVASLVDAGGGDGTTAKAIAKAFPHVRCKVLELPQVAANMPADGMVEFVAVFTLPVVNRRLPVIFTVTATWRQHLSVAVTGVFRFKI